ncbi:hypothetical protein D3C87_1451710 [compost metagenome]
MGSDSWQASSGTLIASGTGCTPLINIAPVATVHFGSFKKPVIVALKLSSFFSSCIVKLVDFMVFRCLGCVPSGEFDAGLGQNPSLNLVMPLAQQIQWPAAVVLLGDRAGLVPLDLRNDTGRRLAPFGQRAERPA